jgi:hypothetical protein
MSRRARGVNLTGLSPRETGPGLQGVERATDSRALTRLRPGTASPRKAGQGTPVLFSPSHLPPSERTTR